MPPEVVESLFTRHGRSLSKLKPLQIIFPGFEYAALSNVRLLAQNIIHTNLPYVSVPRSDGLNLIYGVCGLDAFIHWDRGFESHFGHGCVSAFSYTVLYCVGRDFAKGRSPSKESYHIPKIK
jgi:hypothetical protein